MLHSKFVAINQEAQSALHAALGSGIQGSLIEVSYVILKQLQCCHCMQVFPRLLELGPGQFKAALHRLMMPLPSSGDPSCHVDQRLPLLHVGAFPPCGSLSQHVTCCLQVPDCHDNTLSQETK